MIEYTAQQLVMPLRNSPIKHVKQCARLAGAAWRKLTAGAQKTADRGSSAQHWQGRPPRTSYDHAQAQREKGARPGDLPAAPRAPPGVPAQHASWPTGSRARRACRRCSRTSATTQISSGLNALPQRGAPWPYGAGRATRWQAVQSAAARRGREKGAPCRAGACGWGPGGCSYHSRRVPLAARRWRAARSQPAARPAPAPRSQPACG